MHSSSYHGIEPSCSGQRVARPHFPLVGLQDGHQWFYVMRVVSYRAYSRDGCKRLFVRARWRPLGRAEQKRRNQNGEEEEGRNESVVQDQKSCGALEEKNSEEAGAEKAFEEGGCGTEDQTRSEEESSSKSGEKIRKEAGAQNSSIRGSSQEGRRGG